jgi:hypothetical protein
MGGRKPRDESKAEKKRVEHCGPSASGKFFPMAM